jgi:drug/metabolite transporter (DMT)-like permease
LLHTIGVLAILGLLFAYEAVIHRSHNAIVKNMMSLNQFQLFCVVALSIMTVVSSLMVLQAYQFMSSVLAHTMVLKGLSAVMVVFVGAFVFQENYTNIQLFGVLLVTLGVLLVNHASILDKNFWK